jgi:hypothetical protein
MAQRSNGTNPIHKDFELEIIWVIKIEPNSG